MPNVIEGIADNPKPADAASWWSQQDKVAMAAGLDPEETATWNCLPRRMCPQRSDRQWNSRYR